MLRDKKYLIHIALTVAVMVFIFVHSAMNSETSGAESGFVVSIIAKITGLSAAPLKLLVRKCAHFSEFMALGWCATLCAYDWVRIRGAASGKLCAAAWAIGTLYAVSDEVHQIFVPGRVCAFMDMCIDSAGVLLGVVMIAAIMERGRKRTVLVIIAALFVANVAAAGTLYYLKFMADQRAAVNAAFRDDAVPDTVASLPETALSKIPGARLAVLRNPAAARVVAHRGGAGGSEEANSMAAFEKGFSIGAVNLEMDTFLSKDGTLYISHEPTVYTKSGRRILISGLTDEKLDKITTYYGNRVSKLSDVFDRFGTDAYYYVELKEDRDKAAKVFLKMVEDYGFEDQVVAESRYLRMLEIIDRKYPDMQKLLVCRTTEEIDSGISSDVVDMLGVRFQFMTKANCKRTQKAGKKFGIWTLDTEDDIKTAIDLGADIYFTDYPELAFELEG